MDEEMDKGSAELEKTEKEPASGALEEKPMEEKAPPKEKPVDRRLFGMDDGEVKFSRASVSNWLIFVSLLVLFLGSTAMIGSIASKNWIYYLSLIGMCFLAASVIAGVKSHANYSLANMWFVDETPPTNPWFFRLNRWSAASFWVQLWLFGIGITLAMTGTLGFWATYKVSQGF